MCKHSDFKAKDIVYIYDNCTAHTGKIAGWWMRNIDAIKITICPYTPGLFLNNYA